MVFARPRFDFSDRVRLALGADRRAYWVQRNYTGQRISSRRPRPTWRPGLVDPADPLLVQLERCLSPFSLWRRSSVVAASDFWHRARTVVGRARCFLSFARNRWPNVPQLSVGHSPPRDRVLVDLSRALAASPKARIRSADFPRRAFSAQAAALQTHDHVRGGEADQRRRVVVGPDRARLSLLVAAVADRDRLVGRSKSATVQEIFGCVLSRRRNYRSIFHLGTASIAVACLWASRFSADHDRSDWELLFLQFAHDRALFVVDR